MSRIVVQSKVGADGILRVEIPLGVFDVDRDVQVTVEQSTADGLDGKTHAELLKGIYGSWKGEFERMPVAPPEERNPL